MKTNCAYCWNFPVDSEEPDFAQRSTDHALSCEKNPLVKMAKEACDKVEAALPLIELLDQRIGTPETGYWGSIRIDEALIKTFEDFKRVLREQKGGGE